MDLYSGLTSWSSWSSGWGTPLGGSVGKALVETQAKQQEVFKQELIKALGGNTGAGPGAGASGSLGIGLNTGNVPNMGIDPNTGMDPNVVSAQMKSSQSQRTARMLKNPSSGTGLRAVNGASVRRSRSKLNSPSKSQSLVSVQGNQKNRLPKSQNAGRSPHMGNGLSNRDSLSGTFKSSITKQEKGNRISQNKLIGPAWMRRLYPDSASEKEANSLRAKGNGH